MFFDDDDFLKKRMQLEKSTNYRFCNFYFPGLLFYKPEIFIVCFKKNELIHNLLNIVIEAMEKDGFNVKEYKQLKCDFRVHDIYKIAGIIIEIPDPKIEPECNYVCACFVDEKTMYFESELYEEGFYGLCGRDKDGSHFNYGTVGGDIRTADDMWNAITKKLIDKMNSAEN